MIRFALLIARKDLRLILQTFAAFAQPLLLGLLLIFIFSIAKSGVASASPEEAATIFWLCSIFCQILIYSHLYGIEEANSARDCLILSNAPIQGIWLGKFIAGFILLMLAQLIFIPALIIFLGQSLSGSITSGLLGLFLGNLGICAIGSLLGGAPQAREGRESLLSILMFPLLVPSILGGSNLLSHTFENGARLSSTNWAGLLGAFDAIYFAAGLLLFGFIYEGDN